MASTGGEAQEWFGTRAGDDAERGERTLLCCPEPRRPASWDDCASVCACLTRFFLPEWNASGAPA